MANFENPEQNQLVEQTASNEPVQSHDESVLDSEKKAGIDVGERGRSDSGAEESITAVTADATMVAPDENLEVLEEIVADAKEDPVTLSEGASKQELFSEQPAQLETKEQQEVEENTSIETSEGVSVQSESEGSDVNGDTAATEVVLQSSGHEDEETTPAKLPEKKHVAEMDWYIIHTYSSFENKVKESLNTRAEAFGLADRIGEVLIPTEDVFEMRGGKKVTTKRLLYPGYVLVQLIMSDELWHVVKNTPRVTGFVGGGQQPTPLTADEVNQILYRQTVSAEKPRPKLMFQKNDRVRIVDGPFTNFTGTIDEVNLDRNTLRVMVTIFGRVTPVEVAHFQVEKEKI